jgi:hypothetical protein
VQILVRSTNSVWNIFWFGEYLTEEIGTVFKVPCFVMCHTISFPGLNLYIQWMEENFQGKAFRKWACLCEFSIVAFTKYNFSLNKGIRSSALKGSRYKFRNAFGFLFLHLYPFCRKFGFLDTVYFGVLLEKRAPSTFNGGWTLLRNVDIDLPNYTASHCRRQIFSFSSDVL